MKKVVKIFGEYKSPPYICGTKANNMTTQTTYKMIFENLRKFECELVFTDNGNLAVIYENGKSVWSIYSHTAKGLKSQVTKWCKQNWF